MNIAEKHKAKCKKKRVSLSLPVLSKEKKCNLLGGASGTEWLKNW